MRIGLTATWAIAAAIPTGAPAQAPEAAAVFDTRTAPRFGDARMMLRIFLKAQRPRPVGVQHFCVLGQDYGADGGRAAQVHWREGQRLIRWTGSDDPREANGALLRATDDLDLRHDVVATEADIAGSTYLVTRAWVSRVLATCARHGQRYTVTPTTKRRRQ